MKVVELLVSCATPHLIAMMDDGSYLWVAGDHVLATGPNADWVERGRTAKAASLYGEPSVQRVAYAHDSLVATINRGVDHAL